MFTHTYETILADSADERALFSGGKVFTKLLSIFTRKPVCLFVGLLPEALDMCPLEETLWDKVAVVAPVAAKHRMMLVPKSIQR